MLKQLYHRALGFYYRKVGERSQKELYEAASNLPENEYEDYLRDLYKTKTNNELDFANPVTYTQKLQWLKLYDEPKKKSCFADKYAVRSFIKDTIGEEHLIPLISIDGKDHFYDANEINFDKLPEQFVLKCNHASATNIIVDNKSGLTQRDIYRIKKKLNNWLKQNFAYCNGLELVYKYIKPCIIIEQYMAFDGDLPDYKFFCFNGKAKYLYYMQNYTMHHELGELGFLDMNYNMVAYNADYAALKTIPEKPDSFNEMIYTAEKLAKGFNHVRVDLYNINGKIYFGELTFYCSSGFINFYPNEFDKVLGDLILIDQSKRENNFRYRKK